MPGLAVRAGQGAHANACMAACSQAARWFVRQSWDLANEISLGTPDWRSASGMSPALWAGHSGSQRNCRVIRSESHGATPAVIICGQVGIFRAALGTNEIEDYAAVAGDC